MTPQYLTSEIEAEARNLTASLVGAGASVHSSSPSASVTRPACNTARRMVAVTLAISEPASSPELDWPATLAALVRLTFANTSVEVIDSWRTDQ